MDTVPVGKRCNLKDHILKLNINVPVPTLGWKALSE